MNVNLRTVPAQLLTVAINDATGSVAAVAGVANEQILVWGMILTFPSGRTITLKSANTALTGPMSGPGLMRLPPARTERGWDKQYPMFECASGEALNLVLDSAAQLSGIVYYSKEAA